MRAVMEYEIEEISKNTDAWINVVLTTNAAAQSNEISAYNSVVIVIDRKAEKFFRVGEDVILTIETRRQDE